MRVIRLCVAVAVATAVLGIPFAALSATYTCVQSQCDGTNNADTITDSDNHVMNSLMHESGTGFDIAYGHNQGDNIEGQNGPDSIRGHGGPDFITTGENYTNADYAIGNLGDDTLKDQWPGVGFTCGSGCDKDRACAMDGDDNVYIKDGDGEDKYYLGPGNDFLDRDAGDVPVSSSQCTANAAG